MSPRKASVTLTYVHLGAQPPVFLAGSFSDPPWHPQEMEYTTSDDGEHEFRKEVMVDEGSHHQYKFRIGMGDWWALNEQAPTVTDELGNRNNIMAAPTHMPEESFSESSHSDFFPTPPDSLSSIPDVVVEKVDDEPRHGDDFGVNSTVGQKIAHEQRAADAEPDRVIIRSQTSTPVYASTAAEVADSAALLDREASPALMTDEEAGRTGERRLSSTPIPQVALTAAEVADSAAIIDGDAMKIQMPEFEYNPESLLTQTTPGHEKAPLFAHECVGSSHEEENKDGNDEPEPEVEPLQPEPLLTPPSEKREEIDVNDPTLEEFPQDRISILAHVISTETRLNEDQTNFEGVPPSPVAHAKSRSTSLDTPSYIQLDAQPSPLLDVITEESQDGEVSILNLPSPAEDGDVVEDTKEVPNEELEDHDESRKIAGPIGTSEREKAEAVKDLEQPAHVEESFAAQEPVATEEPEISRGLQQAVETVNIGEPKDSIAENIPVGEMPLNTKEASIPVEEEPIVVEDAPVLTDDTTVVADDWPVLADDVTVPADDTPVLVDDTTIVVDDTIPSDDPIPVDNQPILAGKDLVLKEKEAETDRPSPPGVIREEQTIDEAGLKDVVSPANSTHKKLPEQHDGPTEEDESQSSAIRAVSATVGGSIIGGAIMGGLHAKGVLNDKTAQIGDVPKTSTEQHALQEPTKIDADSDGTPRTMKGDSKVPLPSIGLDADTPITNSTTDTTSPQIQVQVAEPEREEADKPYVPLPKGLDTAKSTSVEGSTINGSAESSVKLRKVRSEDLSSLPASIHSTIKNSEKPGFFISIWRTVFVGWIGGLLARLWGRGSGSLLTLLALILLVSAPALYFSQSA